MATWSGDPVDVMAVLTRAGMRPSVFEDTDISENAAAKLRRICPVCSSGRRGSRRYLLDVEPAVVIRDARERAGLSQRALAERSGVAQPNIAAYEAGRRVPSEAMVGRLLDAAAIRPSTILDASRKHVLAIARKHGATDVRVFGSVARGDDRPGSDIDLLVRFEPDASLLDQAELAEELSAELGVRVDVVSEGGLKPRDADIRREAVPL